MTRSHNKIGMRKGISLMEMLVAIILLGILSSVGFTYYKNYYDTSLAAKQIKVAIILDQAAQLKNGLELYNVKTGIDAITSVDANASTGLELLVAQSIITSVPARVPDMSAYGWRVSTSVSDINSTFLTTQGDTDTEDQFLTYNLDGDATGSDRQDFCNALNNIASNGVILYTAVEASLGTTLSLGAAQGNNTFFCWDSNVTTGAGQQLVFLTKIQ
ncbi:type II secretion system protein [Candidatus Sulfurimonas baltica]|uniref:Type II secretion system protein n=1 Tax=Candidatus Sulfurimonas baltica TaxID=2740404 RepID=A0A7S7LTK9_9BACT|nr:type II secretion system protein [Candidatus Sulfurimonas baltica]QOY51291.1 type II secretion system protein [Candidatus Sulfurimonas baltica]